MPIYCYKCYDCNHYEEIKQKMSDEPLTVCPQCGGDFKRVIRNVGVIFKGSGFHVNDYRSSCKAVKKDVQSGDADMAVKSEDKSTDKPEKTAPAKDKPASGDKAEKSKAPGKAE